VAGPTTESSATSASAVKLLRPAGPYATSLVTSTAGILQCRRCGRLRQNGSGRTDKGTSGQADKGTIGQADKESSGQAPPHELLPAPRCFLGTRDIKHVLQQAGSHRTAAQRAEKVATVQGPADIAPHVVDTRFQPLFLDSNGMI